MKRRIDFSATAGGVIHKIPESPVSSLIQASMGASVVKISPTIAVAFPIQARCGRDALRADTGRKSVFNSR
jgi:hypothetical protein